MGGTTTIFVTPGTVSGCQNDFSNIINSHDGTEGFRNGQDFALLGDEVATFIALLPLKFITGGASEAATVARVAARGPRARE